MLTWIAGIDEGAVAAGQTRANRFPVFWIGLALILLGAAALRMLSYDFGLPYIDHADEPVFYLQARVWRGLFDLGGYLDSYPPVYIGLNVVVQLVLEALGLPGEATVVQVLRLLAVAFNLLALLLIALTARLAAGDLAGWIAGLAWGVSPLVLENGVYATPDTLVYPLVVLALWLAAASLSDPRRRVWCVWSVVVGLLAILTKYPVITAVVPGGLAALALARRERQRGLRYLAIQATLVLATGFWLVFIYRIDRVQREGEVARTQGLANLLDLGRVTNNVYHALVPLEPVAFLLLFGLGLLAFVLAWQRGLPRVNVPIIGLSLLLVVTIPWLAGTFSMVTVIERLKDTLPATTAACVILGAAVAQIARSFPPRLRVAGGALAILPLALFVFLPQLVADVRLVEARCLQDSRVLLRQWADISLEPGMVLVTDDNDKTFNPYWGGIPARHWFDWWTMSGMSLMDMPVETWRGERGMVYAVIPRWQVDEMEQTEAGRDYLAQLLRLRDFAAPPPQRGPEMVVFRFWRMQVETDVRFGPSIRLTGYDQDIHVVLPGDAVTFRFYWQANRTPETNYSLFIHLTTPNARTVLAQADGEPARLERPTLSWNEPGETLIGLPFQLIVPPDLLPGEYRVLIGLYDYLTGQRLPVIDSQGRALGDSLELTRLVVSERG